RATEQMALAMGDHDTAALVRAIYEAGYENLSAHTFNGEYFEQAPGGNELGKALFAAQLVCQTDAFLANLGYVLPEEQVRSATEAPMRHNFDERVGTRCRPEFGMAARIYAYPEHAALLNATFPRGG